MKKIILYTLLLIFFSCTKTTNDNSEIISSREQITQVDSLGTGWKKILINENDKMSDICFFKKTGFAVGGERILKSLDGGNNWDLTFQTEYSVFNVSMGNPENVIAISILGGIYYSNDGGVSFEHIFLNDPDLNEIFFLNDTIAYAVGLNLWKTNDAGKHWQKITELTTTTKVRTYRTVYFINESLGWVISPNKESSTIDLFKTEDGGFNWNKFDSDGNKFDVSSLYFTDEKNGFINAVPNIYRTTDGGNNWELIRSGSLAGLGDVRFGDVHFLSKDIGYISDCKNIYKTINGGSSFTKEVELDSTNANADIYEIFFVDESHGWACGGKGYILKYEK